MSEYYVSEKRLIKQSLPKDLNGAANVCRVSIAQVGSPPLGHIYHDVGKGGVKYLDGCQNSRLFILSPRCPEGFADPASDDTCAAVLRWPVALTKIGKFLSDRSCQPTGSRPDRTTSLLQVIQLAITAGAGVCGCLDGGDGPGIGDPSTRGAELN